MAKRVTTPKRAARERRVTVGLSESLHKQLLELGNDTGQTVSRLLYRSVRVMLETEAPVWRKAAAELRRK